MSDSERPSDTGNARSTRQLSRGKRWLFGGVTAVLLIAILELASLTIWYVFPPLIRADLLSIQQKCGDVGNRRCRNELEVIHPYLGWAFNPEAADRPADLRGPVTVNSLGLARLGTVHSTAFRRIES